MPPPNIQGMLEVAALLADGPKTIGEIMDRCGISMRTAYRMRRMLVRHGYDVVTRPGPDGATFEILDVPAETPQPRKTQPS